MLLRSTAIFVLTVLLSPVVLGVTAHHAAATEQTQMDMPDAAGYGAPAVHGEKEQSSPIPPPPPVSADEAMKKLIAGNQRFAADNAREPRRGEMRRIITYIGGQHPFATVIACSDARVPVEIVFDQGIGDLFVIRNAGNVVDSSTASSVEYGVDHLDTRLVVVMGHAHCGAVTACMKKTPATGQIGELMQVIQPAVELARKADPHAKPAALLRTAIHANAYQTIEHLLTGSAAIRDAVSSGRVKLVAAYYDIHLGKVTFVGPHPAEGQILTSFGLTRRDGASTVKPREIQPASADQSTKPWHSPAILRHVVTPSPASHQSPHKSDAGHGGGRSYLAPARHTPAQHNPPLRHVAPQHHQTTGQAAQNAHAAPSDMYNTQGAFRPPQKHAQPAKGQDGDGEAHAEDGHNDKQVAADNHTETEGGLMSHLMGLGMFLMGGAAVSGVALHFLYPKPKRAAGDPDEPIMEDAALDAV